MSKKTTTDEFIARAKQIHGDKYDYANVIYRTRDDKVKIICPIHGVFWQKACYHLDGSGCPYCGIESREQGRITSARKIFGVAYNDLRCLGVLDVCYTTWHSMVARCYSKSYHKYKPTYKDCTVCHEWLTFSNFKRWFDKNYVEGYHLDKDILVKGNKIYSPETCCFVPSEINTILLSCKKSRGRYPIGVTLYKGRYRARINKNGKLQDIGFYTTKDEAFYAYKNEKENYIKSIAEKYFKEGKIARKVYQALLNYNISIKD